MSKGKWLGRWFKMYDNFDITDEFGTFKYWTGNTDNDELGAWIRLLALASRSQIKGVIQVSQGVPYTKEQINAVIRTDKPYVDKWITQGALIDKNGILYIQNWKHWQNEQDRKDSYTKSNSLNRHPKQTQRDVDEDVVKEVKEEKTKTKTSTKTLPTKEPVGVNMLAFYCDEYFRVYGIKYPANGGKEGKILKGLLSTYGEERLKAYIKTWLDEKYYSWNGKRDVGTFKGQVETIARTSNVSKDRYDDEPILKFTKAVEK